jgi:hypothetical protein
MASTGRVLVSTNDCFVGAKPRVPGLGVGPLQSNLTSGCGST